MSQNWRVGFDPASGTSIGWALARPRLRRLAEESSGHLDEGEKLVTPVAICTRCGRAALFSGLGVLTLTLAMLEVIGYLGNRIGGSSLVNAAFIAGGCPFTGCPESWRQLMAGSGGSQGLPSMAARTALSAVTPWAAAESR